MGKKHIRRISPEVRNAECDEKYLIIKAKRKQNTNKLNV
jgi:hypothetical protein